MRFHIFLDVGDEEGKARFFNAEGSLPASLATLFWLTGVPFGSRSGLLFFRRSNAARYKSPALIRLAGSADWPKAVSHKNVRDRKFSG